MEENNTSLKGLIIVFVVILILALILMGANHYASKKGYDSISQLLGMSGKEEDNNIDNSIEEDTVNSNSNDNQTKYSSVINAYKYAMENENEDREYGENVNSNILAYYHSYNDFDICYAFYDINKDNNDEMIVLSKRNDDSKLTIIDIHGYDGKNPVRLIKNDSLGDRTKVEIFENGVIYLNGSNGADNGILSFNKIESDGYTLSSDDIYYKYNVSNEIIFYSDVNLISPLDYTSIDEIMDEFVNGSPKINLENLEIKTINVD